MKGRVAKSSRHEWKIRSRVRPGDIGTLTWLHGTIYAKECGYDRTFEAYVAAGLAEFIQDFRPDMDRLWLADSRGGIIGSIAVVARSKREAQLRWFLVHPSHRGRGLGMRLMEVALRFCRDRKFRKVYLWTTSELADAARLYGRFDFVKTEERTHEIWGKKRTEEKYELRL